MSCNSYQDMDDCGLIFYFPRTDSPIKVHQGRYKSKHLLPVVFSLQYLTVEKVQVE